MNKRVKTLRVVSAVLLLSLLSGVSLCFAGGEKEADDGGLKAAIVFNGPVSDGGWNADCYQGMMQLKEKLGYEIAYSENVKQADYVSAFREYANLGYDLIVCPGFEFSDAVHEVYADYPDTKFAVINGGFTAENVASMGHNNVQAGFLAGVIAGLYSKSNVAGYVGGTEIPPIVDAQTGMERGLRYINPDAKLIATMAGSWSDMAKGKEIALSQISTANVDVIFGFASAVNAGIIEGCAEKGAAVIGEPGDLLDLNPDVIITSVIISNPRLIMMAGEKVAQGTFSGEAIIGDLNNGGVDVGRYNSKMAAADQKKIQDIIEKIKSGEIDVTK
jgi:basic membrane protein A